MIKQPENGRGKAPPKTEKELKEFKEFRLTSFAIDHSTSVILLFIIVAIAGIVTYGRIPKESFPELEIPMIAVSTVYPGVSPSDMETLVTRPIEDELNTIGDIKELTSTSVEGYSSVVAEFETSVDLDEALQKVREKVDLAKPELPEDAEDPSITEFNFSEVPIMQVNLSGEYGLVRLKEIGEDLQDRLEQIPSVLRADLRGGLEREVKVDVDLAKLKFYGLSIDDVIMAVQSENVNIPGGTIDVGAFKYLVRIDGEFEDPTLIEDLVVTTEDGRAVYVRDVATVEFGFAERETFARLDGNPVVTLDIVKRTGENIIESADAVKAVIAEMEAIFPPSTVVKITSDSSKDIRMMVSSLENNVISGLLLIIGVLFFFLGVRTSVFVALSIPTSMFLSFLVLGAMGVSMNMIVLFSLILALGMLVDNAIVIVENIYRYLEEGWDRVTASKKATGEVAMPVIAATMTTLAAFAPLLFWPGMIGDFMGYLPLTLIITLSSSLFVAVIIIPTLCSLFIRLDDAPKKPLTKVAKRTMIGLTGLSIFIVAGINWLTAVLFILTAVLAVGAHKLVLSKVEDWFQAKAIPDWIRFYEKQLWWALEHRPAVLAIAAGALVGTVMLFTVFNNGVEFFPESIPPRQLWVDVDGPVGTRAEVTNRVASILEEEVKHFDGMGDAESVVTTVGSGGGNFMEEGPGGPEAGRVNISFVDFQDRRFNAFETLAQMQETVGKDLAGVDITVDKLTEGAPTGAPVNIEIIGEDPAVLEALSEEVIQILEADPVYPKLVGLDSDLNEARPELSVLVDREKAALYGLSTSRVAMAVRGAINGIEAGKYRTGNDEYDIIVRLAPEFRSELNALEDLTVMDEGTQVPLVSVADWEVGEGLGSIRRKDMVRVATVSSDVASGYNSNATLAEVQAVLAGFGASLPPGYTVQYTGESEEQDEASEFLSTAFLMALALMGFILISQFNSIVKPVIILSSVVMSTVGVLAGLMVFNMPFVIIMTGLGIISLAGIVVNNAIVLIDYIDILRERDGMDRRRALVQGGKTRFRPVILTATTTALGLVPLAIGLNFDFFGLYGSLTPELYWGGDQAAWWGSMAVAVIVGIMFATFLTLILVPVLYSLVDDFSAFFRKHYTSTEGDEGTADDAGGEGESAVVTDVPALETTPELEPAPVLRVRKKTLRTPPLRPQPE
ncbi:MAG: efflux RND transporter permease subunit [Gemmatimonadetes bacterium]|nr:efflux RND transporter permease subunit [Gemmatimonadota bacterium]